MVTLESLCLDIISCKDCDLYYSRRRAVCGTGTGESGLMIIGEAPGPKEDMEGTPFVGRSGTLMDKVLKSVGLTRDKVYLSNAVRCRPRLGKSPKVIEIKKCAKYLRYEVELIKPRIIVPMGNSALKALSVILGYKFPKVSEIAGRIMKIKNFYVTPQYHPAAILRNPKKLEIFKDNFYLISQLLMDVKGNAESKMETQYEIEKI